MCGYGCWWWLWVIRFTSDSCDFAAYEIIQPPVWLQTAISSKRFPSTCRQLNLHNAGWRQQQTHPKWPQKMQVLGICPCLQDLIPYFLQHQHQTIPFPWLFPTLEALVQEKEVLTKELESWSFSFFLLRSKDDLLVKHMVADYHLIYLIHSNNVIVRIEWQQYDSAWSHDSKGTWLCHL